MAKVALVVVTYIVVGIWWASVVEALDNRALSPNPHYEKFSFVGLVLQAAIWPIGITVGVSAHAFAEKSRWRLCGPV